MLERINLYDGGVVTFAKNLSDQGKTIKEILEEIQIQFANLPSGTKGKSIPTATFWSNLDATGPGVAGGISLNLSIKSSSDIS